MDWSVFFALPGDSRRNFELVTRGAIRAAYARFGRLRGARQQPGVEYYLVLDRPSPLGEPPRVYGWQCRFYDDEGYLDQKRRDRIELALAKAIDHVDGLTDFVLWTKLPLRDKDATWLESLPPDNVTCHTWHEGDLEVLLAENAPALKAAFFGGLVVTPDQLKQRYSDALDHIVDRFDPKLHVEGSDARQLQRALGAPELWRQSLAHTEQPGTTAAMAARLERGSPWLTRDEVTTLGRSVQERMALGDAVPLMVADGRFADLLDRIDDLPPPLGEARLREATQAARAAGDHEGERTIGWLWDMEATAQHRLTDAAALLGNPMIAVVGGAGVGKTHLAATIAAPHGDRPAGPLVLGKKFGETLDAAELAAALVPGASNLDQALDALQAAAERSRRKLPLVIDGINESDDPFAWRPLLTDLRRSVTRRPHLLAVVTVRPDYAERCLPPALTEIELSGFERWQAEEAVNLYFDAYKIEADVSSLPWLSFEHPLFLRIFCEAINPDRDELVWVDHVPEGQAAVFELFIERVLQRIGERQPRRDLDDARARIRGFALKLWQSSRRSMLQQEVKALCGDPSDQWESTLTQQLISEGLLRRDPPRANGIDRLRQEISFVFDLVAGHAIGSALISDDLTDLTDAGLVDRLLVGGGEAHPLAQDIVSGLETTLALAGRPALWQVTTSPALRREALLRYVEQPSRHVVAEAVIAVSEVIAQEPELLQRILPRVLRVYDVPSDPFNAGWLDRMLRPMPVWRRDLVWTEWVRTHQSLVTDELRRQWVLTANGPSVSRDEVELTALFFSWCLTSTVRGLRDETTALLWRLGLDVPQALFALAVERLDINDPYVVERCMAIVYGIFMANAFPTPEFQAAAPELLARVHERVVADDAECPISHWLARAHVTGVIGFTRRYFAELLPESLRAGTLVLPTPADIAAPITENARDREQAEEMLGEDFENYTIGQLSPDRGNYDHAHAGHRRLVAEVLGRAWSLGWRTDRFGAVDRAIAEGVERSETDPGRTERYGKKYSWIGYYEAAGRLDAAGALVDDLTGDRLRLSDMQIDPSFPAQAPLVDISIPMWTNGLEDDQRWVRDAGVEIPMSLLRVTDRESDADWICAYGEVIQESGGQEAERRVFALVRLVLVPRGSWQHVAQGLQRRTSFDRSVLPDADSDYYTYAGEMPWAEHFALEARIEGETSEVRLAGEEKVAAEILAHCYAWERYHSVMNDAGGAYVPSWKFSNHFDLRGGPGVLDQFLRTGELAATSRAAPPDSDGHLLYLREDLVRRYAADRDMDVGLVIWGEKILRYGRRDAMPAWYSDAVRQNVNVHRTILSLDEAVRADQR